MTSLYSYAQYLALRLRGGHRAARDAALDWVSSQVVGGPVAATQAQPFGPDLFARWTASSLSCVSTYTPSFFLAQRANSFRREVLGI